LHSFAAPGPWSPAGGGDPELGENGNTASGEFAVVSGGSGNAASGGGSVVSGGQNRTAEGEFDWVAGTLWVPKTHRHEQPADERTCHHAACRS
jgi:hypothetical protein